jgi:predicted Zn finger-like uncharacterized protein
MILTCPSCGTRYRAESASFAPPGRNVRCAKCAHVWFQTVAEPETTASAAPLGTVSGEPARPPSLRAIVTERKAAETELRRVVTQQAEPKRSRLLPALGIILILLLLAGAGWAAVQYRQTVVRLWPSSERVYGAVGLPVNLTGIAIRDVDLRQQVEDGMPVLFVTGTVVNVSTRDQPVPQLRAILFDDSRRELYRWTFDAGISSLSPGASKDFRVPLQNPPPDARAVNVSFAAEDPR